MLREGLVRFMLFLIVEGGDEEVRDAKATLMNYLNASILRSIDDKVRDVNSNVENVLGEDFFCPLSWWVDSVSVIVPDETSPRDEECCQLTDRLLQLYPDKSDRAP